MHLSKGVLKSQNTSGHVLDYKPRTIQRDLGPLAKNYVDTEAFHKTNFKMSDLVAQQVGITEIERASLEGRVEQLALEKMKQIEEAGYKEAYALGLEEGRKKAFEDNN